METLKNFFRDFSIHDSPNFELELSVSGSDENSSNILDFVIKGQIKLTRCLLR